MRCGSQTWCQDCHGSKGMPVLMTTLKSFVVTGTNFICFVVVAVVLNLRAQ